jgi:hypothetical protein
MVVGIGGIQLKTSEDIAMELLFRDSMERKDKESLDPREALDAAELVNKIGRIDLDALLRREKAKLTPMEQLAEAVAEGVEIKRRKHKAKKQHWRTAQRKRKVYYRTVYAPHLKKKQAELLRKGAEGWYTYLTAGWRRRKVEVDLTLEEFTTVVWPALGGRIPIFYRYDTTKPLSLSNIWVEESESREKRVLFDGMEHTLKASGYSL